MVGENVDTSAERVVQNINLAEIDELIAMLTRARRDIAFTVERAESEPRASA